MEPQRISSLNSLPPPITNFPFSDPASPFFSSPSSLTFLTSFDLSAPAAAANFFAQQHPQHMLFQQQQQPVMGSSLWDHHPLEFGSFSAGIPPPLISAMDHLDASCLSMQDRKAMPDLLQHLPELLMKLAENPAHAKEIVLPSSTESAPQTSSVSCDQKHSSPKTSASTKDHTQKQAKQGPKKSRKAQQKRVVCVPATGPGNDKASAEAVPSDSWAWRKYGQKPIKGSPYPRGYYRCSTCKGCSARKQVERNKNDPTMFIITYTSDHNHPWPTHRNSLAGSTRPKPSQKAPDAKLTTTELYEHADGCHEDVDDNAFSSIVDSPDMAAQQFSYPPPASHASPIDEAHNFSPWRSGSVEDEDFFTELQELPDSYLSFGKDVLEEKPDEEAFNAVLVDPYNLWVNNGVAL